MDVKLIKDGRNGVLDSCIHVHIAFDEGSISEALVSRIVWSDTHFLILDKYKRWIRLPSFLTGRESNGSLITKRLWNECHIVVNFKATSRLHEVFIKLPDDLLV